jgi:hypothetical protein
VLPCTLGSLDCPLIQHECCSAFARTAENLIRGRTYGPQIDRLSGWVRRARMFSVGCGNNVLLRTGTVVHAFHKLVQSWRKRLRDLRICIIQTRRINQINRIVSDESIRIDSTFKPRWVFAQEPTGRWIVVSGAVVIQVALRVEFPGVAIGSRVGVSLLTKTPLPDVRKNLLSVLTTL